MKTTEQAGTYSAGPGRRSRGAFRRARFSLVELLVVIAIMAILMAVVVPAFKSFGGGVSGASRMVGSQLRLARQYAIAHRKRVAVLMPGLNQGPDQYRYVAFRSCVLDSSYQWQSWITGTKWEFLPTGAVIAEADDDNGMDNPPQDQTMTVVTGPTGSQFLSDFPTGCRAVIFKPTGATAGGQRCMTVAEGFVSNGSLTIKNAQDYVDIYVDQYTGRVSYKTNL